MVQQLIMIRRMWAMLWKVVGRMEQCRGDKEHRKEQELQSLAMVSPRKKRRAVLALFNNTTAKRSKDEPWCYKSFREIWEGNIEYYDQSSESEIQSNICFTCNSSPPTKKPNLTPLKPEVIDLDKFGSGVFSWHCGSDRSA